jgi:peptide subunit release factor 1 (eRF1)
MFLSASERDVRDDLTGKAEELIPGLPEDVEGDGQARSAAIADELVARARHTNADVTFIEDATKLAGCGGVGAKLRFRL